MARWWRWIRPRSGHRPHIRRAVGHGCGTGCRGSGAGADSVGVQGGVQAAPARALLLLHLDGAGLAVAPEEQVVLAAELRGFDHLAVGQQGDLGTTGDIETGFHRAVVAEADAQAGVGAQQALLAEAGDLFAAARERAHDGGAAADVGTVAHHYAGAAADLDHALAQGAGVEIAEALVHHRGAFREVRAQAHAVGVGDAHARRDDVVGHARELVDARHLRLDAARLQARTHRVELVGIEGALAGPHHVVEQAEDAVEVEAVGSDLARREHGRRAPPPPVWIRRSPRAGGR